MTTITIPPLTLPDELAAKAKARGLLSPDAIEAYLREKVKEAETETPLPEGFDPRLKGLVDPALFGKGEILGDIVAPLDVEWEAAR